jgi:hypothetical protein
MLRGGVGVARREKLREDSDLAVDLDTRGDIADVIPLEWDGECLLLARGQPIQSAEVPEAVGEESDLIGSISGHP